MKIKCCVFAALVVAACAPLPVAALDTSSGPVFGLPQGWIMAVRAQVQSLRLEFGALEGRVRAAQEAFAVAQRRYETGTLPADAVSARKLELQQLQVQMAQMAFALQNATRLTKLADPVDIDLKDSDIRKAAEALSRVSDLKIAVADSVPKDVVVTAQAKSVPLGAILEVIANAAGLVIAPDESDGVVLRPSGRLTFNGQEVNLNGRPQYDAGNLPWSDEWGASATSSNVTLGRRWLNLFTGVCYQPPATGAIQPEAKPK